PAAGHGGVGRARDGGAALRGGQARRAAVRAVPASVLPAQVRERAVLVEGWEADGKQRELPERRPGGLRGVEDDMEGAGVREHDGAGDTQAVRAGGRVGEPGSEMASDARGVRDAHSFALRILLTSRPCGCWQSRILLENNTIFHQIIN
ncbi:hypothetical protein THAOC_23291, partial [Thalassiosira oceanica]